MLGIGGRGQKKIITDASGFYTGKLNIISDLHETFYEHLLASEYGWTLEYIRNIPLMKFNELILICFTKNQIMQKQIEISSIAGMARG